MTSRPVSLWLRSPWVSLRCRPRPRPHSGQLYRGYSTSTSGAAAGKADETFPLPLPRALAPSKGLLLLSLPIAPVHWPSHLDLYSTLYRKTAKALKSQGVAVNCIYDGHSTSTSFDMGTGPEDERYPARLYGPAGLVRAYPSFSLEDLPSISQYLDQTGTRRREQERGVEILVCTHGSRDCRCSDHGGALVDALRAEAGRRGLQDAEIKIGEIAHVGGHKYAANAVVLPSLNMYSNLRVGDAGAMLDHLFSTKSEPSEKSPFWAHWRGRYAATEEEQARFWATVNPSPPPTTAAEQTTSPAPATPDPVNLVFRTWDGEKRIVPAHHGETLLQVARREDLPSMEGTCGGNLECSTCHVYLDPLAPVPEPSDDELDMLGYALGYREDESRLGCQIKVDDKLAEWCRAGGEMKLPRY